MVTFKARDLMVSVVSTAGGAMLPADDQPIPTPITPKTPVISVIVRGRELEAIGTLVQEAVRAQDVEGIRHIVDSPMLEKVADRFGHDVVVSAMFGGATVALPDPNCGGSSLETIPTPITPIVHEGRFAVRVSDLPVLKEQLTSMLEAVNEVEASLEISGREAEGLAEQLGSVVKGLGGRSG